MTLAGAMRSPSMQATKTWPPLSSPKMSEDQAKMSQKDAKNSTFRAEHSQVVLMNARVEASTLLRQAAEPRPVGDTVKQAIWRAARRVSAFLESPMHFGRAEDIWRARARVIRAEERDAIRKAATDRLVKEARNEFAELTARIARLEATLRVQDEDFHGPQADALRQMAGPPDRPLD